MLGSVGERYTPATPDEIAALDARLRKRGAPSVSYMAASSCLS